MVRMVLVLVVLTAAWQLTPNEIHWPWLWIAAGVLILPSVLSNILQMRVAAQMDRWAASQGLTLRGFELEVFKKGPFTWTTSDCQRVLRITAIDGDKKLRKGWMVVGDWNLGLLWPKIRVRWD